VKNSSVTHGNNYYEGYVSEIKIIFPDQMTHSLLLVKDSSRPSLQMYNHFYTHSNSY
jgi:hypothetical protein